MLQLCAQALKAAANRKHAKKLGWIFIPTTKLSHPAKVIQSLNYKFPVFEDPVKLYLSLEAAIPQYCPDPGPVSPEGPENAVRCI